VYDGDVLEGSGEGDCADELQKVTARLMARGATRGRPGMAAPASNLCGRGGGRGAAWSTAWRGVLLGDGARKRAVAFS
jgi:hypothetical protein